MNLVVIESKQGKNFARTNILMICPRACKHDSLVEHWEAWRSGWATENNKSELFQSHWTFLISCIFVQAKVNMWSSARGGGLLQGPDVFYEKFSDFHEATLRFLQSWHALENQNLVHFHFLGASGCLLFPLWLWDQIFFEEYYGCLCLISFWIMFRNTSGLTGVWRWGVRTLTCGTPLERGSTSILGRNSPSANSHIYVEPFHMDTSSSHLSTNQPNHMD